MNRLTLWSIPVTLAWPASAVAFYVVRYGQITTDALISSFVFLPMGAISAIILVCLVKRSTNWNQKASTIFGYVMASPFAFIVGLMSGFIFPPLLGTLFLGVPSLVVGTAIGYIISGLMNFNREPAR